MIIILNNKHDAASRAFVEANPGYRVIDWYDSESQDKLVCDLLGIASISAFPTVVDTDTKKLSTTPATMDAALKELAGMDEARILQTRLNQVDARTTALIETGMDVTTSAGTYRFPLTPVDREQIMGVYIKRAEKTYPWAVKAYQNGAPVMMPIASAEEIASIFNLAEEHVVAKRQEAWAVQIALQSKTYQELVDFVDVR